MRIGNAISSEYMGTVEECKTGGASTYNAWSYVDI